MGQSSLILALMTSLLLGGAVFGFISEMDRSNDTTTDQFIAEHALNVANSGVNLAVSRLRQNKLWRTGFSSLAVDRGTVTVTVVDIGVDTVRITSAGTYADSTRVVSAIARLSSLFPTVQSALAVYGDTVAISNSGKSFLIDGRDYRIDGTTLSGNPPVWGVGTEDPKIADYLKTSINTGGIAPNVQGQGGAPSVGVFSGDSIKVLRDLYKSMATRTLAPGKYSGNAVYGTLANPEIVYIPGDLNWDGNIEGAGILVVDGQLDLRGKVSWKGIVIAIAGGLTIDLGASGTPSLLGTTLVGNSNALNLTHVKINGNPSVKYSYETVATVLSNLDLLAVKVLSYYE
ncbi:MAG: hypothetical protein HY962_05055 [Ignavibacteriae bacterium]|nr:hypothetical protein [Ignavibacteriota bacterium]